MSASRSKTRSREAAVAPLELVGRGTTSCVVRTGPNRLMKIVTKLSDVEPEAVRAALLALDPQQRRLAGPLSVVVRAPKEAEREALRRCVRERPMRGEKIDAEAEKMAFVELMDAGKTVGTRKEHGERLTVAQASAVLVDAIAALEMLRAAGWVHGDVQQHNIAVQLSADGAAIARMLDFGLTRRAHDPATGARVDISGDHRGFVGVASAVLGLVDREAEPARYKCLSDALAAFRSGTKGLPMASQLRACAAGPAAAPAEAPTGPSRSPGSPSARLGARRRMDFSEEMAETPAAPESAARRRERSGEADDGAGPSKTARALF